MFEMLIVLMVLVTVWGLFQSSRRNKAVEAQQAAELEAALTTSRRAADEDVTKFGEELQRLDSQVAGHPLDAAMRQDYERALDAYENAKSSLAAVTKPDEIRHVTEVLEDGRYAIACVNARVAGEPLPQKRPPCFFNPAHGPSTQNVKWTPPGGAERDIPACAADAERVLAGADPYIRTVQVGAQRVPYWQGGPAYAPWAQGYYTGWSGSNLIRDIAIGSMVFHGMSGLPYMMDGMGDGMGEMFEGIGDGFESIGDGIGGMFDGIGDFFGD
ncbi:MULTISPECIES: hypothetical protein [Luteococcus]|uniref:Putative membrane protein n=1 Tax=Luteococcus japonicus LSP_Lj1 TaxID=1255658 RepID=A0A1R4JAQ5_9ACTN|nr:MULTISPECIES: hypothetical protein [Luteococcus]MDN5562407.1 hypothetical protein [Luteococcus sp.]SJN29221.1 putative membrane protein [Luteococcus japonicus LSP_Lj1]